MTDSEGEVVVRPEPTRTGAKLEIQLTLVASIAHITEQDVEKLNVDAEGEEFVLYPKGAGFLLGLLPGDLDRMVTRFTEEGYSAAFVSLIRFGVQHNCGWLILDPDGPEIDGLPKFDW